MVSRVSKIRPYLYLKYVDMFLVSGICTNFTLFFMEIFTNTDIGLKSPTV